MRILTASVVSAQPDYVALAMVLVLLLVVAVMAIRKRKANAARAAAPETVTVVEETPVARPAPGTAGQIKLHDVDPKTAAMLMAIVAHKMGKPLNELRFISIKETK